MRSSIAANEQADISCSETIDIPDGMDVEETRMQLLRKLELHCLLGFYIKGYIKLKGYLEEKEEIEKRFDDALVLMRREPVNT